MSDPEFRKSRRARNARVHVRIPVDTKYTTLPSADVLLDPNMVREIVSARIADSHPGRRQTHSPTRRSASR